MSRVASDVSCRLPESVRQTIVLLEDRVEIPYQGRLLILGKNCLKPLPVRGLRLLLNVLKFRRVLKGVKPDVVLAFHHDARVINLLSGTLLPTLRYATVLAVQGVASQYGKHSAGSRGRLHRFLVLWTLKRADRIIACSEGVKSDLVAAYGAPKEKIEAIYNSVDADKIRTMASETVEHPWFSEKIPIVTLSGRLVFEKNQSDLVRAFALVRKERPCRLVLIGDGKHRDAIAGLADELGVSKDVLFTGYQKNPFKFISRSAVFAFPSIYEALALALVEAMAVGCPIVAYDCPVGPRELLAPGTARPSSLHGIEQAEYGLLVPVGDVQALAKGILQLLEDTALRERYSRLVMERSAHFNLRDMVDAYFKVLSSVA